MRGSETERKISHWHVSGKGPFKVLIEEILRLVGSQGVRRVNKTICWQKKMQLHRCGIQKDWEASFSPSPHSADEMWSFAQSCLSSMKGWDRHSGVSRRRMMTGREEERIWDGLVSSSSWNRSIHKHIHLNICDPSRRKFRFHDFTPWINPLCHFDE